MAAELLRAGPYVDGKSSIRRAFDRLPPQDQEELLGLIHRKMLFRGRERAGMTIHSDGFGDEVAAIFLRNGMTEACGVLDFTTSPVPPSTSPSGSPHTSR